MQKPKKGIYAQKQGITKNTDTTMVTPATSTKPDLTKQTTIPAQGSTPEKTKEEIEFAYKKKVKRKLILAYVLGAVVIAINLFTSGLLP